jgi:N-acylneuraminate cytidylyltransferase
MQFGDVVSIVPLRAGSKGLVNKNTCLVNGKPLYQYTIDQSISLGFRTIVSTDISEISQPKDGSFEMRRRSPGLCKDTTPMADVIIDVIKAIGIKARTVILLQATSPLREQVDILACLAKFRSQPCSLVMSCTQIASTSLKYGLRNGDVFEPINQSSFLFTNRQQLPKLLRPNGAIYVFSSTEFIENNGFPTRKILFHEMPESRSLDIDDENSLEAFREIKE